MILIYDRNGIEMKVLHTIIIVYDTFERCAVTPLRDFSTYVQAVMSKRRWHKRVLLFEKEYFIVLSYLTSDEK